MQNKNTIITVGLGVVLLFVVGMMSYNAGRSEGAREMHMGMMQSEQKKDLTMKEIELVDHSQMTMDEMTRGLDGLTGDAFDKAFIEMMIVHHQGAVDMAGLIPINAKHAELKKLGEEIITTQTKEIEMMNGWLKSWGYAEKEMMNNDTQMEGMDHSMMGM